GTLSKSNALLIVEFKEAMQLASNSDKKVLIRDYETHQIIQTYTPDDFVLINSNKEVALSLDNVDQLKAGRKYYVVFPAGFVLTANGNKTWQGVFAKEDWLFIIEESSLPNLTTTTITDITETSAISGGDVISDGGEVVTKRGVCWSTSNSPTISDTYSTNGNGIGAFNSSITGLTAGTSYYVRAYATNATGTEYGTEKSFTTTQEATVALPTLTTNEIVDITQTSASCGGNIASDGGAAISERGVCWSTSSSPTIVDNHTSDDSGTGAFNSSITGLTAGTSYYVRAYATNATGTAYGTEKSFTTTQEATVGLPTLTTNEIVDITQTSASCGGNVETDGGGTVTQKGVCWSTSSSPTLSDSYTNDGANTGFYMSNLTGLTANTNYYVRAYATNAAGTAYGSEKSFITSEELILTTVSSVSPLSATMGTETTFTVTGVNLSDDLLYHVDDLESKSFMSLSADKTEFKFKGMPSNFVGNKNGVIKKADGAELYTFLVNFTLTSGGFVTGLVNDIDGNNYNTIVIGEQEWMSENLKVTKYSNGTSIPKVTDNTQWADLENNDIDKAYCYYNNNENNEKDIHGALYTYAAATNGDNTGSQVKGVCPNGWHIPSDSDWYILENYLIANGYNYDGSTSGNKLGKALAYNSGWSTNSHVGLIGNNQEINNSTGFSIKPGGTRFESNGNYSNIGLNGRWWTSTTGDDARKAYFREFYHLDDRLIRGGQYKSYGFYVRCVKD
ncbi:hypothetical protein OAA06_02325, partial [bacterium]|nr:hypothetical protein [bacterium]